MKLFKYYVLLLALACLSVSCVVTKNQKANFLSKYCERKDSTVTITKDSLVYKDTTIYKSIAGPTQYLENPCKLLCDSLGNLLNFTPITKKENGSKGTIFKVGNSIGFKSEIDSMGVFVSWTENHVSKLRISHTENRIEKPCELEHITSFNGFEHWWFIITAGILVLWILIKIFKANLKAWFPFLSRFLK